MLVQRVLLPATRRESWTVLGDDGPVQPIERYLAYLTDIERSPNTVKAYAHDHRHAPNPGRPQREGGRGCALTTPRT